jgi:hypothetical protein
MIFCNHIPYNYYDTRANPFLGKGRAAIMEITAITAIVSLISAIIGVGKGGVDLFQTISALIPAAKERLLSKLEKQLSNEGIHINAADEIYAALEQSSQRVEQILKRIQKQFVITVFIILILWILLLTVLAYLPKLDWYSNAISTENNIVINLIVDLGGFFFAWYFARWPQRLKKIKNIANNLKQIQYNITTNRGENRINEITKLEDSIKSEIRGLARETKLDSVWDSLKNIKYYLEPLPISTVEADLLEAHLKLSALVSTTEAFVLKTTLIAAQAKMEELAYHRITGILFDAFSRLVRLNALTKKPAELPEIEEWKTLQKETIEDEMKRLGLDYLLPYFFDDFYTYDYPQIESRGELMVTLKKEIATAQTNLETARENKEKQS